jgi:hypothetical protein
MRTVTKMIDLCVPCCFSSALSVCKAPSLLGSWQHVLYFMDSSLSCTRIANLLNQVKALNYIGMILSFGGTKQKGLTPVLACWGRQLSTCTPASVLTYQLSHGTQGSPFTMQAPLDTGSPGFSLP